MAFWLADWNGPGRHRDMTSKRLAGSAPVWRLERAVHDHGVTELFGVIDEVEVLPPAPPEEGRSGRARLSRR